MLNFKQYSEEFDLVTDEIEVTDEELDSILEDRFDMNHRLQKRLSFKRRKAKLRLAKKIQSNRLATPDRLKNRAQQRARNVLIRRFYQGRNRGDIPLSMRRSVDARLANMKSSVKRIAQKLLRRVKLDDIARKTHRKIQHTYISSKSL